MDENKIEERLAALEQSDKIKSDTIQSLQDENKALLEQVKKLSPAQKDKAKEPEKIVIPEDVFTVKGKKYKFQVPKFRHNGVLLTATDALADNDVLQHLADKKSGIIKEVK